MHRHRNGRKQKKDREVSQLPESQQQEAPRQDACLDRTVAAIGNLENREQDDVGAGWDALRHAQHPVIRLPFGDVVLNEVAEGPEHTLVHVPSERIHERRDQACSANEKVSREVARISLQQGDGAENPHNENAEYEAAMHVDPQQHGEGRQPQVALRKAYAVEDHAENQRRDIGRRGEKNIRHGEGRIKHAGRDHRDARRDRSGVSVETNRGKSAGDQAAEKNRGEYQRGKTSVLVTGGSPSHPRARTDCTSACRRR